jgi:ribosome-associated protein
VWRREAAKRSIILTARSPAPCPRRADPPRCPALPMRSRHRPAAPPEDDADVDLDRPSKSQRKRDSHEVQKLGEALAELNAERLAALPLPENLRDAVLEYQRTRSHEGRRRQMQYVGRLMRAAPLEPIREAIDSVRLGRAQDALVLHRIERWRDELVASDDTLTRWAEAHPASDLQQLRSLVRSARREATAPAEPGTPPERAGVAARKGRAYRELFQFIKHHEETSP